jgi:hypothetical protein
MKGKPPKIDLLELYAKCNTNEWNNFLNKCLSTHDLHKLQITLYGIQLGMNDLVDQKLNTEKVNIFFIRLQRSIENTMKQIIKLKKPHPLDNAFNKEKYGHMLESKRARDQQIEMFLKKVRF